MALFKKVEEKDIGVSPITLAVVETDDGIVVGRIVAAWVDQFFSTAPYDPLIADAISIADRFATANKVAVSVYDPQNHWQSSWGDLHWFFFYYTLTPRRDHRAFDREPRCTHVRSQ